MRKLFFGIIAFCMLYLGLNAQPTGMGERHGSMMMKIDEEVIKNFINAQKQIDQLPPEDQQALKTNDYRKNQNAPVYQKVQTILNNNHFANYMQYVMVTRRIINIYKSANPGANIQQNNPNPNPNATQMNPRAQARMNNQFGGSSMGKMNFTDAEKQVVANHSSELKPLLEK